MSEGTINGHAEAVDTSAEEHDPHFEPIIQLPLVDTSTHEEDEIEMIKLRAKLFRFASNESPAEWKERGTGDVKLLRHTTKHTVRIVMRRDKTLKICANHFVTPAMDLAPNCGSDRAFVWSTNADFSDETAHSETLAIRFANPENARKWKEMFDEAKKIVSTQCELYAKGLDDSGTEEGNEKGDSDESEGEKDFEESFVKLNLDDLKSDDDKPEADSTTGEENEQTTGRGTGSGAEKEKGAPDSTTKQEKGTSDN